MTRLRRSPTRKVKIDKGIPLPPGKKLGRPRGSKWPFAELEIGDSFVMTGVAPRSASSLASMAGRKLGKKFASRLDKGVVRVWRVKK